MLQITKFFCTSISRVVATTALFAVSLAAQDVIHFENGDKLSGRVKRLERGQLVVAVPAIDGDINVDWHQIKQIDTERLFQFQTRAGDRFVGTIEKQERGAGGEDMVIVTPGIRRPIRQEDVVFASQTITERGGLLELGLGAGLSLSKSNSQRQSNVDAELSYQTAKYITSAEVHSLFSSQLEAEDTNRHNLRLELERSLSRNWSVAGLADFLSSAEQSLDLRTTLGGGPVRTLIRTDQLNLNAIGGIVWNHERYSSDSGIPPSNGIEALGGIGLSYYQFRQWTLSSMALVFPSLTVRGRVRLDWRSNIRLRLIKGRNFWWNFSHTLNLDSKPPSDASGTDYVTTTSLSWSFP